MSLEVRWDHSGFSSNDVLRTADRLLPRLVELKMVLERRDYTNDAASILLPSEREFIQDSVSLANEYSDSSLVVVIGIGGSNLGTMAIQRAVLGKFHNIEHPERQIFYPDTVDSDSIESMLQAVKRASGRVVVNAVTKSGATTETVANLEVLLGVLTENRQSSVVVTTDQGSKLEKLARTKDFRVLSIPQKVGGRYSVFSNVGLFPLALMGINLEKLLDGAAEMLDRCLSTSLKDNPAAVIASLILLNLERGISIHDHFLFSNDLEAIGKWYRQLMGESIGKEWNASGTKRTFTGITPTVSIGSTDLHSMAQLYLGGPRDKLFRFVIVSNSRSSVSLPHMPEFEALVENIQGLGFSDIMDAVVKGVQRAFVKANRPFIEVILPDKSERSVGQLLQLEMIEMMLLAKLLDVNPYDQPAVENYKIETRELLKELKTVE